MAFMGIPFTFTKNKYFYMIRSLRMLIGLSLFSLSTFAQNSVVPNGWHMMDKAADGYSGVSANKAYEFLKSK